MNADSLASRQRQDGCYCEEDIEKILFDREAIERRVREMGRQITEDYRERVQCQGGEGKPRLLVVSVLRGAAIFMGDLVREINLPLEMDYMVVSSYGASVKSSGVVRILKDISSQIEGRHVLVAEDVLDSGLTLKYLLHVLESRNPASIQVATLLRRPIRGRRTSSVRMSASNVRMISLSAMASTMRNTIETCLISAF